jgi:exopolysaccharide biosynthesis protein
MLLTGFFVFCLLDAFVIPRPMQGDYASAVATTDAPASAASEAPTVDAPEPAAAGNAPTSTATEAPASAAVEAPASTTADASNQPDASVAANAENPVVTDSSYESAGISIRIDFLREYDTNIYVADIRLSDATALKTAFAYGQFGRNIKQTTSEMAEDNAAILAINGDFYGFSNDGAVVRNGVFYREGKDADALVVGSDGMMRCMNEAELADADIDSAWQIWSFGPPLIESGGIVVDEGDEVSGRSSPSNPRTAIGQAGALHYVMLVSDGRTEENAGLSLTQLAEVMKEYGCETAYNLDGGGSSCMVFRGKVLNEPTTGKRKTGEREVSDIVYIG